MVASLLSDMQNTDLRILQSAEDAFEQAHWKTDRLGRTLTRPTRVEE